MSGATEPSHAVTLFLGGDVMTGRGIDQIMLRPSRAELRESYMKDARGYVELARNKSGPIPMPVDAQYVWGEALGEFGKRNPDVRIANLETSVTRSDDYWNKKGIHYRMHPENIACLTAARLDVCALANNHVLDFGERGLLETLEVLQGAGIQTVGAGRDPAEARLPAALPLPGGGRILVLSFGTGDSGVPWTWQATATRPGIDFLSDLSEAGARQVVERVARAKQPGDIVVASIHWGRNWGYEVPAAHIRFAHRLVEGGVDVIHGHSSHHPRPIEVWNGRLILYGCGDFIDDYESISGYEAFRDDLVLMYFAKITAANGDLVGLEMVPMQIQRMRLAHASADDAQWIADRLARISEPLGSSISLSPDGGSLRLARASDGDAGGAVSNARLNDILAPPHGA